MIDTDLSNCSASEPFALRVVGDEMAPEFEDGHIIIVDPGGQVRSGGMPVYKIVANRFLTLCENLVLGLNLSEAHTGFRAYSREMLCQIPFLLNSDDFVFDTQVIVQAVAFGFRIGEIGVPTRYFEEASSVNFRRSVVYGLSTLWVLAKFLAHKWGLARVSKFSEPLRKVVEGE